MRLVAAGLTFHNAPLALRERAVIRDDEAPELLRYLTGYPGITGAAVLSTCNRTEFYVTCGGETLADQVVVKLGQYLDPGNGAIAGHLIDLRDGEAVEHICRVAAGLDSMVVGEAQVLGQVRAAHRLAAAAGTLSAELDIVLRGAIEAGKRVRTETAIGRGAGSLGEVALGFAESVVGDLSGRGVLLIGAGKMNRLAARRLVATGADVHITSRSESARRLANEVGASALDRDGIAALIDRIDVVITSTSSPSTVVSARDVAIWQARRHGRPLVLVDLAVPRDVELSAADVPGVHLADIDELGIRVERSLDGRRGAVPEAEAIVAAGTAGIATKLEHRSGAGPTITALVEHAEEVRRREMERTLAQLPGIDPGTAARIDQLTQSLVRKLLHAPIGHLRSNATDGAIVDAVREVFALDSGEAAGATSEEPAGTPAEATAGAPSEEPVG